MTTIHGYQVNGNLFEQVPNSDFAQFLDETINLLDFAPEILGLIEDDLDQKGKEKKVSRILDSRFILGEMGLLPGIDYAKEDEPTPQTLTLLFGRPRMNAKLVYLLLQVQGYVGSLTSHKNQDFLRESRTFGILLEAHGWPYPSRSTLNENLNKVSIRTQEYILKKQLEFFHGLNLDDFKELTIDSTSVSADSKWPTDSGVILALLNRAFRVSQQLDQLECANFREGHCPRWLKEIKALDFQINIASGKKGGIKGLYTTLLKKAEKFAVHLTKEYQRWNSASDLSGFRPSRRTLIEKTILLIMQDTADAQRTIQNARSRLSDQISVPAKEKILSISDQDAAYIQKGGREPVVGYKPQLVRSKEGFIANLVLPLGNASDAAQFVPVIEQTIKNTGVVPELVNGDDGYASARGRKLLLDMGIKVVNISGSKGKKIIPEEDWDSDIYREARRNRSAVESLMSIMKGCFGLGRMCVRGFDNVYRSMLQKALAYNFLRCVFRKNALLKAG